MKLYILTSSDLPFLCPDDQKLTESLQSHGIDFQICIWDKDKVPAGSVVLVRTVWDYASKTQAFNELLKDFNERNIKCLNAVETLRWNMDKSYLVELGSKGANIVPTYIVQDFSKASITKSLIKYPLVVKPLVGASGIDTFMLKNEYVNTNISNLSHRQVMIQPFIKEIKSEGEVSFIYFDGKYSHSVLKTAREDEFRVQDDHGGSVRGYTPSVNDLEQIDEILSFVSHEWLYARVDVVKSYGIFYLMELEMIEPELFFRFSDYGEDLLSSALLRSV